MVAILVNTCRTDFNSRRAIRIFHLYKILLIAVWLLSSVTNTYQKYILGVKDDCCKGLKT